MVRCLIVIYLSKEEHPLGRIRITEYSFDTSYHADRNIDK